MTLPAGFHAVSGTCLATVVTYLDMQSPAPLRGTACPEGAVFEPLERDIATYRDIFRRVGRDWLWFGRLRMAEADLMQILENPAVVFYTLSVVGRPEALLELDFREEGACELAYFGLTSRLIGSGAGAFLMDRAIELAWAENISRFHVHTCTLDSPQALPFYIRSGFVPTRREVEITEDPRSLGIYDAEAAPQIPLISSA